LVFKDVCWINKLKGKLAVEREREIIEISLMIREREIKII
jgi:hypothetical protein